LTETNIFDIVLNMNTALIKKSSNVKIGKVPVTISSKASCPKSCPLNSKNGGGCYAESGPQNLHWTRVSDGKMGMEYDEFVKAIAKLDDGQFFRHNVSGDLYGDGLNIDIAKLVKLVLASKGKKGYAYSHYTNNKKNLKAIAFANKNGFTINLSGNSISHANELVGNGSPVVCVVDSDYQRKYVKKGGAWLESEKEYKERIALKETKIAKGNRLIICPATYRDNVTCDSCRLCQKVNRSSVIAFPAHGINTKKANVVTNK